jgi:hypothetical protein
MSLNVTPLRLAVLQFLAAKPGGFNAKSMVAALCPRVSSGGHKLSWTEQGLARQTGKMIKPLMEHGLIVQEDWMARMCSMRVRITDAGRAVVAAHESGHPCKT